MKTRLLLLLLLTSMTLTASDHTTAALAAEARRGDALRKNDAAALADLLSDELRYVHSTGKIESKPAALSDLAEKRVIYERFLTSELHAAEIAPGVVSIFGKIDQKKFSSGKWGDVRLLFLGVWRNEAGTWRMVSMQTALPPPKS